MNATHSALVYRSATCVKFAGIISDLFHARWKIAIEYYGNVPFPDTTIDSRYGDV